MASPRIVSVATAVPAALWPQEAILERLAQHFPFYHNPRVRQIFLNSGIESRHLAMPPEKFGPDNTADNLHEVFKQCSVELGKQAASQAMTQAGVGPAEIDLIAVATSTGYLCPGLSARLARELGLQGNLRRADLVGMGCAGAMPALQRASDFVRAYPQKRALAVTVEVSSACWFVDQAMETVVGNAICADGAAAVVISTSDSPGPRLESFETLLDVSYLESVGFSFEMGKNRIVLSGDLRYAAGPLVRQAVENLLAREGLSVDSIDDWVVHAGGRRVLDGIDAALGFTCHELRHSRDILRTHGNMSSPTVLFALQRTMEQAQPGATGVMIALGPGLAAEIALLRW
ncbi:MAG: type III polyketide synthase [Bryobacteraceae bacterium]